MTPLPPGFGIELDRAVRVREGGRTVLGGRPRRIMQLTETGARALAELRHGPARSSEARLLGRRLVEAGMAHPRPPRDRDTPRATVVVPVRDRPYMLDRCLEALDPGQPVIVVDDGSSDPDAIASVARRHAAQLLRLTSSRGPAAARNRALPLVSTDLIAFLDSDCVAEPGWLRGLEAHLEDPLVGAAAPRLRPLTPAATAAGDHTAIEHYLAARSPLDMGPWPAAVQPRSLVPYVPSAALLVRRAAIGQGFDEALRYGEDVDLVWRLADAGWRVRYEPRVVVRHEEPSAWIRAFARRFRYGTSAAPLARRHPGRLAPAVLSPVPVAATGLLLFGHPKAGAAVAAAAGAVMAGRLHLAGAPAWLGPVSVFRAVADTAVSAGHAGVTLAGPVIAAWTIRSRRARWPALVLAAVPPLVQWLRRRPRLDPIRWTAAALADDVSYGAGVWWGCIRHRTTAPLMPSWRPRLKP